MDPWLGGNPERNGRCGNHRPPGRYAGVVSALAEGIASVRLESFCEPHVEHLEGKLWELRLTGRDGIGRALYVTAIRRKGGRGSRVREGRKRPPRSEIELALQRAKEVT